MASILSSQHDDIFISYSQADNEFRWVNRLMDTLKALFKSINRDVVPRFHFDERSLRGNDPLDETLKRNVQNSGVFLIVMSENWCDSTYCPRELQWFIEAANGLDRARRRIFVLRLSEHPVSRWPGELKQNIGKPFFVEIERTGIIEPISFDFRDAGKPPSVCADLALELWECLEVLERVPPPKSRLVNVPKVFVASGAPTTPATISFSTTAPTATQAASAVTQATGSVVFVSEVHPKLAELRRKLSEDLRREGYRVVPTEREFRNDRSAAELEIPAMLRQASFVVLLHYDRPIGTEEFEDHDSFDGWLRDQAASCGKIPEETWLRWRRHGLQPEEVSDLKHRALLLENDVVAEDEAQLTNLVLQRMHGIEERARANVVVGGGRKILVRTKDATKFLADVLSDEIDVFGQDAAGVPLEATIVQESVALATVEEQLKKRSVATVGYFVVYGDTDEDWANARMKECRNLALKRRSSLPVTAVYVKPPDDQPRPQTTPGRFEVVRHNQVDKLHQVLQQASEVRS